MHLWHANYLMIPLSCMRAFSETTCASTMLHECLQLRPILLQVNVLWSQELLCGVPSQRWP